MRGEGGAEGVEDEGGVEEVARNEGVVVGKAGGELRLEG